MSRFAGKKIAILGLGVEGRDLAQYLLKKGAQITVFDQKSVVELGTIHRQLSKKGVSFRLGKDYLKEALKDFNFIFRSPGFYPYLPEIVQAKKEGAIISSATKLFFNLCPGKIIGVTGTKGKGTTATLIYRILKEAGKEVFLAGNIGEPMLALLPKLTKESWVVLELSSFQLIDLDKSPYLAVVLFITSEHLDYHKNTKEYIQAKSSIVRYQTKKDYAVFNLDNSTSASFAKLTPAKTFFFSRHKKTNGAYVQKEKIYLDQELIGSVKQLKLIGPHNWDNVCAATTAGYLVGVGMNSIKKAIFKFKGLEHRLEPVEEVRGVKFYNDSFSTTPETTIAAIKSFKKPIILIAGGSEKGSDYSQLGKEISQSPVKALVLIGEMAERIKETCLRAGYKGEIAFRPKNMKEAVQQAFNQAQVGEVILLSPACASFDMFENYKDRGKQFKKYVQALKEKKSFS